MSMPYTCTYVTESQYILYSFGTLLWSIPNVVTWFRILAVLFGGRIIQTVKQLQFNPEKSGGKLKFK